MTDKQTEVLKLALEALEINLIFLGKVSPAQGQEDLLEDCLHMTAEQIAAICEALAEQPNIAKYLEKDNSEQPATKPWVGLTDEEIEAEWVQMCGPQRWAMHSVYARAIEAALCKKNEKQPKAWIGLTNEEILKTLCIHLDDFDDDPQEWVEEMRDARAIETKLREKNT